MNRLWTWVVELDRILRGEKTRVTDLRDGAIQIPALGISVVLVLLAMFYGICMGCYAVVNHGRGLQMLASMIKVPALFILTLAVTLPSLYVFNAIVGSRLTPSSLIRLFIAALGVNIAVLSSLGPIVAFFSISTTTYSFMVLLNVVVFAVSGLLGLTFLLQTLHRLNIAPQVPPAPPPEATTTATVSESTQADNTLAPYEPPAGLLNPVEGHVLGRHIKTVFGCWMIVFALVGAQMSWILRPYIGSPEQPFEWFRPRGSNFFEAVWRSIQALFG